MGVYPPARGSKGKHHPGRHGYALGRSEGRRHERDTGAGFRQPADAGLQAGADDAAGAGHGRSGGLPALAAQRAHLHAEAAGRAPGGDEGADAAVGGGALPAERPAAGGHVRPHSARGAGGDEPAEPALHRAGRAGPGALSGAGVAGPAEDCHRRAGGGGARRLLPAAGGAAVRADGGAAHRAQGAAGGGGLLPGPAEAGRGKKAHRRGDGAVEAGLRERKPALAQRHRDVEQGDALHHRAGAGPARGGAHAERAPRQGEPGARSRHAGSSRAAFDNTSGRAGRGHHGQRGAGAAAGPQPRRNRCGQRRALSSRDANAQCFALSGLAPSKVVPP